MATFRERAAHLVEYNYVLIVLCPFEKFFFCLLLVVSSYLCTDYFLFGLGG